MEERSEEKIFDHQLQLWEDTADREFDAMMERTRYHIVLSMSTNNILP